MKSTTIAQYGPFKLLELENQTNDYALTDDNESVYLGFKAEEQPDLLYLLEEIDYEVEA